ncbi:MAG: transposase [Terriglobia bacterium]
MGEKQNQPFQLSFNSSMKVDFRGSRVTSDGGLILVRELDESLGFGDLITQHLTDSRRGKNTQLPLADLLRQSVYSRIAGYEDVNDAERLSQDPTFRLIGSEKIWERGAVLPRRSGGWSLTSLQQRPVKTGGRLIKHARYYWLLLAESHLTRRLYGAMLCRIAALPSSAG